MKGGERKMEKMRDEVNRKICDHLKANIALDIFEQKRIQMQAAWAEAKRLKKDGEVVTSLGPLISEAWSEVKKQVEQPSCPVQPEPVQPRKEE